MNCPKCGEQGTAVTKTLDSGNRVRRRRLCACGWQQTSAEGWEKGTGAFMAINDGGQKSLVARGEGGDIDLFSGSISGSVADRAHARSEDRAKKKSPYSEEFEACWREYGRKEEKVKAYARWRIEANAIGGEHVLRDLVLKALSWQGPRWAQDGWQFAKYFERYLKAHRWEDEPMPEVPRIPRRAPSRGEATVENLKSFLARKGASKP